MKHVIGLIGSKQAGKTTTFNSFAKIAPVQEISLAAKIKNVVSEILQIPRNYFDSSNLKEMFLEDPIFLTEDIILQIFEAYQVTPNNQTHVRPHIGKVLHTPRQVAQYIGTELLRSYDNQIHCKAAIQDIDAEIGVVTDIRFPNEFIFFKENFPQFTTIYIKNTAAEIVAMADGHESEKHIRELSKLANYTLVNDKSLTIFENNVKTLFVDIMGLK
jgi:hypothetical protein